MCNCNTTTQCNNCCNGIPCGCPPVYTLNVQPLPCKCCPSGYTYSAATSTAFPTGVCISNNPLSPTQVPLTPIPCIACEDMTSTDCVNYPGTIPITCATTVYGINPNDTLTTILSKMCITNENVLEAMLSAIGNSTRALAGFCQLVTNCGSIPGTSTPILGPITFTIP